MRNYPYYHIEIVDNQILFRQNTFQLNLELKQYLIEKGYHEEYRRTSAMCLVPWWVKTTENHLQTLQEGSHLLNYLIEKEQNDVRNSNGKTID